MSESLAKLREKARNEYGITNADDIQEGQLRDEIKAIDDQANGGSEKIKSKRELRADKKKVAAKSKDKKTDKKLDDKKPVDEQSDNDKK